jgi:hypothetical protein
MTLAFAVAGLTRSSLTARLDMAILCLEVDTGLYAGK